jgi:putative redox protein
MATKTPTVVVASKQGEAFAQEIRAGLHKVVSDEPLTVGGSDLGPTPVELFLAGLGACTAMTLQMMARRRKWDLQKVTVRIYQDMVDDPAGSGQKILQITEEIEVEGNLSQTELKGLEAAAKKCPVYKMLTGPKVVVTNITHANAPQAGPANPAPTGTAPAGGSRLPSGDQDQPSATTGDSTPPKSS